MADTEFDEMSMDDQLSLGEALPISDMPSDFMPLKDMDDFSFLDEEEEAPAESPAESLAETPAETSVPEEKPNEAAVDPLTEEKLAAYNRLDTALRENPAQAIRAIFEGMSVSDRSTLAGELGLSASKTPERESFNVGEYEPQGEMEQALASRWNDLESIPALKDSLDSAERKMEQGFGAFVPHITDANIASQIALAKIEALCDALQIALPDPDSTEIIKALQSGKTTYRDAVRTVANYKGQVDAHKQTRAPRPQTPGGGPRNAEKIPTGTDAVTIARRLGVLPRR